MWRYDIINLMSSTETISCFGVSYNHKEIQIDFLMNENWEMYSRGYMIPIPLLFQIFNE